MFWAIWDQLHREGAKIRVVVWDLDGTLGELPGWEPDRHERVADYVVGLGSIQRLLRRLSAMGVRNILASRNGMFCTSVSRDGLHPACAAPETVNQFLELGFDEVGGCYAQQTSLSKVRLALDWLPHDETVLLLDDQAWECELAAKHGAYAIELHQPLARALVSRSITIHRPTGPVRNRRPTRRRSLHRSQQPQRQPLLTPRPQPQQRQPARRRRSGRRRSQRL